MPKLKTRVQLETAFGEYFVDELLGEGGSGRYTVELERIKLLSRLRCSPTIEQLQINDGDLKTKLVSLLETSTQTS